MAHLTESEIKQIASEIGNDTEEYDRRALVLRRHAIYRDAGKRFIVEQLEKEFGGPDAIKEMRLASINILKKIVNKRSSIYQRPPIRRTDKETDQKLIDFYVGEMAFNQKMAKANRYYNLHSNCQIYIKPMPRKDGFIDIATTIVPPHHYSVRTNQIDKTKADTVIYNAFTEEGRTTPNRDTKAVGPEGFSRERGVKQSKNDQVESNEKALNDDDRILIFWNDNQHFTTDSKGNVLLPEGMSFADLTNPIGRMPSINLAKDRDNEFWAKQGEDLVEMSLALQLGLSDVLTIMKSQGFSIMTIVSEEQPSTMHIGINKAIWLKTKPDGPTPSISYVQATSPIGENMDALLSMLRLLLTTNDMAPGTVSGSDTNKTAISGFSQIIEMSDTLQAVESDKPDLVTAEKEAMEEVIPRWHNWAHDQKLLKPEARALGKFSEDFLVQIIYQDVKAIESEDEVLDRIGKKQKLGFITRKDGLKELHPDMTDDQIDEKIKELDDEKQENIKKMQDAIGGSDGFPPDQEEEEEEDKN